MRGKVFLNWILCENNNLFISSVKTGLQPTDCIPEMINKDILQHQFTKMFDL